MDAQVLLRSSHFATASISTRAFNPQQQCIPPMMPFVLKVFKSSITNSFANHAYSCLFFLIRMQTLKSFMLWSRTVSKFLALLLKLLFLHEVIPLPPISQLHEVRLTDVSALTLSISPNDPRYVRFGKQILPDAATLEVSFVPGFAACHTAVSLKDSRIYMAHHSIDVQDVQLTVWSRGHRRLTLCGWHSASWDRTCSRRNAPNIPTPETVAAAAEVTMQLSAWHSTPIHRQSSLVDAHAQRCTSTL